MASNKTISNTDELHPQEIGSSQKRAYRWVMLALVSLPYAAFGLVERSVAPLVTPILSDLEMSYGQMGLVLGSWQLTFIGVGIIAGSITDRFGVRKAVFIGTLIMSLSAVLRYFASGFIPFLFTVMLLGAGAPLISIGAPTAVSHWFSGKSRGIAVGVYTTAAYVGGLIALSATNSLVMPLAGFSWRLTFFYFGFVTFIVAVIWLLGARDARPVVSSTKRSIPCVFSRLTKVSTIRIIFLGGLLSFCTSHGLTNWLPNLFESRGMSAAEAGFMSSIPMFTGIFSVLFIPSLTSSRFRGKMVSILSVTNVLAILLLAITGGAFMVTGLIVFGISGFAVFPLLMLMLLDTSEVESNIIGLATGIFFAIAEIGSFSGPLLIGTLLDITGSFLAGVIFLVILNLIIMVLTYRLKTSPRLNRPI